MPKQYPYVPTLATIALLALVAALPADQAQTGMRLAIHWNDFGKPDTFAAAWTALLLPLALCTGLTLVLATLYRSLPPMPLLVYNMLVLAVVYQAMIVAPVFGIAFPYSLSPLMAICGLFYILFGNSLPKTPLVIRAPQTLLDADRLIAGRRFAARFWILAGVVILVAALAPIDPAARGIANRMAVVLAILPPFLHSLVWRRA
jgi:uncharacterized membrane protein